MSFREQSCLDDDEYVGSMLVILNRRGKKISGPLPCDSPPKTGETVEGKRALRVYPDGAGTIYVTVDA
jgi:hypothetical protein